MSAPAGPHFATFETAAIPAAGATPRTMVGRRVEYDVLVDVGDPRGPDAPVAVGIVVGEAGIGKTTLLQALADAARAADRRVVWVTGDAAETDVEYGLTDQLMRRLAGSARVGRAFGTAEPAAVDVGSHLVRLVDEAAPDVSMLIVVDDAQFVDPSSLAALTFAIRRSSGDRLGVLVATRPEGEARLPSGLVRIADDAGSRFHLAPFDHAEVAELSEVVVGHPLEPGVVDRLHAHTAGNPLHVRLVLEEHGDGGLDGLEWRLPSSLGALFLSRLVTCRPGGRALLDALAVLAHPVPLFVAEFVGELTAAGSALDELLAHGLVELRQEPADGLLATAGDDSGSGAAAPALVAIRQQLVAAAVVDALPDARRRELHGRAAMVSDGDVALRHRVQAAGGRDPVLAVDLQRRAGERAAEGARTAAARLLFAAARLADADERAGLVLVAVHHLLTAGRPVGAWFDDLEALPHSALRTAALGRSAMAAGQLGQAHVLLEQAWHDAAASTEVLPDDVAAAVAESLALIAMSELDIDGVVAWADRIGATDHAALPVTLVCHGLATRGAMHTAHEYIAAALEEVEGGARRGDALLGRGIIELWSNRLDDARRDLATVAAAPAEYSLHEVLPARVYLAEVHLRAGRLLEAGDLARTSIDLLDAAEAVWLTPFPHAVAAFAATTRGELDVARRHAGTAAEYARRSGDLPGVLFSSVAEIRIAETEGDDDAVLSIGDRLLHTGLRRVSDGINPWRAIYAESLVARGRIGDADTVLAELAADVEQRDDDAGRTDLARARISMAVARGDERAALTVIDEALALDPTTSRPVPRARLELAAGQLHRRAGRRGVAAELLERAAHRLRTVGAVPWLGLCERELVACGLRPAKRSDASALQRLTPQERVIARLVAEGRSNPEVAAELCVSRKTIEHHLSRIYRKLHVRGRTHMAAVLDQH